MNRENLVSLCESFAVHRGVLAGRVPVDAREVFDPVPEILASFFRAEISESEKNALLALVRDGDEDDEGNDRAACVVDPYEFGPADPDDDLEG